MELAHQDVADRNLLTGRVRYYGDDIAAVVAEDEVTSFQGIVNEADQSRIRGISGGCSEPEDFHAWNLEHPIHLDKKDNILARSSFAIGDVDSAMDEGCREAEKKL